MGQQQRRRRQRRAEMETTQGRHQIAVCWREKRERSTRIWAACARLAVESFWERGCIYSLSLSLLLSPGSPLRASI